MGLSIVKIIGAEHFSHVLPCRTGHASKFKVFFLSNPVKTYIIDMYFFKLGFTPRKDERPLQGMKLQEKEV